MTSQLQKNTAIRLAADKDFKLFLKIQEEAKAGRKWSPTTAENWGFGDLQMLEAVRILKDMIDIQSTQKA